MPLQRRVVPSRDSPGHKTVHLFTLVLHFMHVRIRFVGGQPEKAKAARLVSPVSKRRLLKEDIIRLKRVFDSVDADASGKISLAGTQCQMPIT